MSKMKNIYKLKIELKAKAKALRETKARLKEEQRNGRGFKAGTMQCGLLSLKRDYRHHHIAYCELRGKTREQIEHHYRDDNHPCETTIQSIKETYAWTPEEIEAYTARQERRNEKA
jgi:hypothetical protein